MNFIINRNQNAQDQFPPPACAEDADLRNSSEPAEEIIDPERVEIHFHHLKAFTKGMHVVWTFDERADGVLVTIAHDLNFRLKILAPIAEKIIGDFFIGNVANKTLRCMKQYVEARANPVTA